jgi:hypothetical protein
MKRVWHTRDAARHVESAVLTDNSSATSDLESVPKPPRNIGAYPPTTFDKKDYQDHSNVTSGAAGSGDLSHWNSGQSTTNSPGISRHNSNTPSQPVSFSPAVYWNKLEDAKGKLPPCWERRLNPAGKVYYVDHNTQQNIWMRPAPLPAPEPEPVPRSYFDGPHRGSDASANNVYRPRYHL